MNRTKPEWEVFLEERVPAIVAAPAQPPLPPPVSVAGTIEHTLLAATATAQQVVDLCAEAKQHSFAVLLLPPLRFRTLLLTAGRQCA